MASVPPPVLSSATVPVAGVWPSWSNTVAVIAARGSSLMTTGVTTSATTAVVADPESPAADAVTVTGPASRRSSTTCPGVPLTSPVTPDSVSVSPFPVTSAVTLAPVTGWSSASFTVTSSVPCGSKTMLRTSVSPLVVNAPVVMPIAREPASDARTVNDVKGMNVNS